MSNRDEKYKLDGCIESDEGFSQKVDNKEVIEDKENNNNNDEPSQGKKVIGVKDKQKC